MAHHDTPTAASGLSSEKRATPDAEWLLSDWSEDEWLLEKTGENARVIDGKWRGVIQLSFNFQMTNGDLLTDDHYEDLKEDVKRLIFYSRSGAYAAGLQRAELQARLLNDTKALLDFMIDRGLDQPSGLLAFDSLTPKLFEEFCEIASTRGYCGLNGQDDRLIQFLNSIPEGRVSSLEEISAATAIPSETLLKVRRLQTILFESNRFVEPVKRRRQREAPPVRSHDHHQDNQGITRAAGLISVWKYLNDCRPYLRRPLSFDPFRDIVDQSSIHIASSYGAIAKKKTPTIPHATGLFYLNRAIEWVVCYGNDLVDYHNHLVSELHLLMSRGTSRADYYAEIVFRRNPPPSSLNALGIRRFHSHQTGTPISVRRAELSVIDAIRCLTAAAFILFATFTARRKTELVQLDLQSVVESWDGFDVIFAPRKISDTEQVEALSRPIPDLLNVAFEQLSRMHEMARESTGDEIYRNRLFVHATGHFRRVAPLDDNLIDTLDFFADCIEVPINADRKRWYLRPHECRRLFAIAYFWHKEFHDLDSLSWLLGHLTPEETRHYILESLGQLALDEVTAERTLQALRSGNDVIGISSLTRMFKIRFGVEKIEAVHDEDLNGYIEKLLANDDIDVRVIESPEDSSKECLLVITSLLEGE